MPTVLQTGTADLVLSTPMTVYTSASNKHYCVQVNVDEMLSGDTLVITIKGKTLSGDAFTGVHKETLSGVDGGLSVPIYYTPHLSLPYGIEVILEQTAGTARDFKWQVSEP